MANKTELIRDQEATLFRAGDKPIYLLPDGPAA